MSTLPLISRSRTSTSSPPERRTHPNLRSSMPPADKSDRNDRDERQERERSKAVELAVGQIEKQFGKGSIMRLGQKGPIQPIDAISTGAMRIDYALGVGGVPRGRVIEIFGPESSGKTTLALQIIAEGKQVGATEGFWSTA